MEGQESAPHGVLDHSFVGPDHERERGIHRKSLMASRVSTADLGKTPVEIVDQDDEVASSPGVGVVDAQRGVWCMVLASVSRQRRAGRGRIASLARLGRVA